MPVLIPFEETNLGFHPSFSRHDRDQAACLSSFIYIRSKNVRQCSLSFQRTSSYIVHTTKTFNLCVLQPSSKENIRCAASSPFHASTTCMQLGRAVRQTEDLTETDCWPSVFRLSIPAAICGPAGFQMRAGGAPYAGRRASICGPASFYGNEDKKTGFPSSRKETRPR